MNKEIKDFIKEMVSIIVIAFILAMILRTFVIEGRIIPTGSMLPTIQLEDRVMVNKFIYYFKDPQRGDIVVFDPPEALNTNQDYIKRIIGLPGEKVEMKNGRVYINAKPLNEPYLPEKLNYEFGPVEVPQNSLMVLGDNRNHSFDSHMWNAWLTSDRVKGKAFITYWPVKNIKLLERGVNFDQDTGN
ncbi:MAG: signal peptidase I [Syntrophomonadaceae bacterium]|nr:signal peptidase I [Syntrophomonadaceae bacterium]MDD4549448.1 signal peptidase I [Syntrophomonadaceae bacterium]